MAVTLRSYLYPDAPLAGFELGEALSLKVPAGSTLGEFAGRFFHKQLAQIGVLAVNGKLATEETVLQPGDTIDIYALLEGG